MAQDSKRKRYTRRLKRQATLANRMLDFALKQRDAYRSVGQELALELKKKVDEGESLIVTPTLKQIAETEGLKP